ncbi:MAG: SRPBCC family protein [Actinomycetota bacterium]|nr:SRPBCC family protein [Actinomycetota bacterium]
MTRSVVVETSITIDAPPQTIWSLITDWERQGDWMLEASEFVVVGEQREGVGVAAEATVKIGGIKTRDRVRVVGWEPPYRLAIRHEGWVSGLGELFLTPVAAGETYVFWREQLEPPLGLVGATGIRVFKPLMRRIFRRDLQVLARIAASSV